jgi:hypothetical protein
MTPRETNKDKLIDTIASLHSTHDTTSNYERAKAELLVACAEDLIKSIDNNSKTSHSLATKVFWLNIVLTSATVIGTIIAILTFFCRH